MPLAGKSILKVAVVGCGIGKAHMRAYKNLPDLFDLQVVCDVDRDKARMAADDFSVPDVTTDFDQLCTRDDLDLIDLATPPGLHYAQILKVLDSDKHVVCEKPLVGSVKEVDDIMQADAKSDKCVMPIFQNRFGDGLQKVKLLCDKGIAGRSYLTSVDTQWYRGAGYYAVAWRGKWRESLGGILLAQAIHNHDILYYINGPFKSIYARTATLCNNVEVEDTAAVSVEMQNGSLATLSATQGSCAQITRIRFSFEGFTAESGTEPYKPSDEPWRIVGATPEKQRDIDNAMKEFQSRQANYEGQFSRFHEAVHTGGPLPVDLDAARASIELVSAMYFSARTGRPVDLPITQEHPAYSGWLPEMPDPDHHPFPMRMQTRGAPS